jgi:methyl-accepting chemotaxis protein
MKNMIGSFNTMIGSIKSSVDSLDTSVETIKTLANQTSEGTRTQADQANQISVSAEEMSQTIVDVANNASGVKDASTNAMEAAITGRKVTRRPSPKSTRYSIPPPSWRTPSRSSISVSARWPRS